MGAVPSSTTPMSIQAASYKMNSTTSTTSIANRFAALAVDDDAPITAPAQPQQQAPRRAYVPPNLRRNQQQHQQPFTQSRLTAVPKTPNVSSASDFPSLGARHTPAAAPPRAAAGAGGGGWASRARSWAEHDETTTATLAAERERRRREQEEANMITLSRPTFRTQRPPTFAPGTSEFVPVRRYIPSSTAEDDDNNDIDAAEAYVGGYDHARYAACDYEEEADDYPNEEERSHTPPYPPYPY